MSIAPIRRAGKASNVAACAASWVLSRENGPLSDKDEERFAAWLAEDPAHVDAYEDAIWALDAAAHYAGEAPILKMRDAALSARREPGPRRWWAAAGGALAASVAALWLFVLQPIDREAAVTTAANPNSVTYRTQVGERLTVTLPDGSTATIDTASELRVAYSDVERRLDLVRGQALFEVAHDRPTPFRVSAAGREILATGTVFNVRIDGGDVRVALLDGAVRVRRAAGSAGAGAAEVRMRPGDTLRAAADGTVAVRAAEIGQMASWRGGELVFNDSRLADAVAELNRYAVHPIQIEGQGVAELRVSGVFRTNDPERFSLAVSEVLPVALNKRGDGKLILKAR